MAFIINKLYENGYEAFAVGGCVRDAIMGRTPHDWDITTSATPMEVKSIFHKTIDTGIAHGTVTVMIEHVGYEVTTYRIDGSYADGRHPDKVTFTPNLIEDLKRRDFTINAMAYNQIVGVVDEFNGTGDLEKKIIRCVGNPYERFGEDALRILRAIRFAAQLDFDIDEETINAVKELGSTLSKISRERVQAEMTKMITSNNPRKMMFIKECDLARVVFGESILATATKKDYEDLINIIQNTDNNHYIRYAVLLSMESNPEVILRGLKFDNKTIKIVTRLVNMKDMPLVCNQVEVRKAIVSIGEDIFEPYYLPFVQALVKGGRRFDITNDTILEIYNIMGDIYKEHQCLNPKDLAICGRDLLEMGIPAGKEVGRILTNVFEMVIENPKLNNKEQLILEVEKQRK